MHWRPLVGVLTRTMATMATNNIIGILELMESITEEDIKKYLNPYDPSMTVDSMIEYINRQIKHIKNGD
jgi:phosphopantothenate synthetase